MVAAHVLTVAVFGAYGHTGRFVVAELRDRGYVPLLLGRDAGKLQALAAAHPGTPYEYRVASVDDPATLDEALQDAVAVVNCAGPFASTASPVIEAALRVDIPYVDVAAEIEANVDTFAYFADRARAAGIAVVPAMAFYGGLGDPRGTHVHDRGSGRGPGRRRHFRTHRSRRTRQVRAGVHR